MNVTVWNTVDIVGSVGVYNLGNTPLNTTLKEAMPGTTFTRDELYLNTYSSDVYFISILLWFFSWINLLISLIFLLRIVILWILLILSPFLLILAIFLFSRSLFKTWAWVYLRWIIIGPLLAMGLGIVVHIWQITGIPIQSLTSSEELISQGVTNLTLTSPFQEGSQMSNNYEVMQIIIVILMLYAVIFLPFWLTNKSNYINALDFKLDWKKAKFTTQVKSNYVKENQIEEKVKNKLSLNKILDNQKSKDMINNFQKNYNKDTKKDGTNQLFSETWENKKTKNLESILKEGNSLGTTSKERKQISLWETNSEDFFDSAWFSLNVPTDKKILSKSSRPIVSEKTNLDLNQEEDHYPIQNKEKINSNLPASKKIPSKSSKPIVSEKTKLDLNQEEDNYPIQNEEKISSNLSIDKNNPSQSSKPVFLEKTNPKLNQIKNNTPTQDIHQEKETISSLWTGKKSTSKVGIEDNTKEEKGNRTSVKTETDYSFQHEWWNIKNEDSAQIKSTEKVTNFTNETISENKINQQNIQNTEKKTVETKKEVKQNIKSVETISINSENDQKLPESITFEKE